MVYNFYTNNQQNKKKKRWKYFVHFHIHIHSLSLITLHVSKCLTYKHESLLFWSLVFCFICCFIQCIINLCFYRLLCHCQHHQPSQSSRSFMLCKFGFISKSFAFGIIEGNESLFTCSNSNQLISNSQSFKFWQCDINELLHQNIVLPYVPSSIAFNDFIVLSDFSLRNWKPQRIHNPSFLSNARVLQRISLLLFDKIKHLTQTVSDMQRIISKHESDIVELKLQLANKHRLYIVCNCFKYYFLVLICCLFFICFCIFV